MGEAVERCLACEAVGEQENTFTHALTLPVLFTASTKIHSTARLARKITPLMIPSGSLPDRALRRLRNYAGGFRCSPRPRKRGSAPRLRRVARFAHSPFRLSITRPI
jgi:hypothetical protein